MKTVFKGRAFVLGNNIDTDQIYPGRYLELVEPKELGSHCLEGVDPTLSSRFSQGDIVVAGTNFGCGSSREHAPIALINMGASVVIADSFARIFFRNAINLGLPLLVCKGINQRVQEGESLEINLVTGTVTIERTGEILEGEQNGDFAMTILGAGGIKPLFRERMGILE